jgi:hypothetical protein
VGDSSAAYSGCPDRLLFAAFILANVDPRIAGWRWPDAAAFINSAQSAIQDYPTSNGLSLRAALEAKGFRLAVLHHRGGLGRFPAYCPSDGPVGPAGGSPTPSGSGNCLRPRSGGSDVASGICTSGVGAIGAVSVGAGASVV